MNGSNAIWRRNLFDHLIRLKIMIKHAPRSTHFERETPKTPKNKTKKYSNTTNRTRVYWPQDLSIPFKVDTLASLSNCNRRRRPSIITLSMNLKSIYNNKNMKKNVSLVSQHFTINNIWSSVGTHCGSPIRFVIKRVKLLCWLRGAERTTRY